MREALRRVSKIPARIWLVLFIISALVCVFALRHNNQQMVKLRDDVYAADKNGGNVNQALNNLRNYVYGHMNTNLTSASNGIYPPIQLQYTYQRLLHDRQASFQASDQKVYAAAQAYCQSIGQTSWGLNTIGCIQNYVVNHGVKNADINIPTGLYEFDFVSPTWSPDLAGWSLLTSIILFAAFLIKFIYQRFFANKK